MALANAGCSLGQPADLVATADLWARVLAPKLPPGALPALAEVWMFSEHAHRWPTPRDLMELVETCRDKLTAAPPKLSPEEEWRKVDHAIRSFGGSDFGIRRAQDYLGADLWQALGGSSEYNRLRMVGLDELVSERARFCAARKAQVRRAEEDRRMGPALEVLTGGGELTARKAPGLHVAESLPARVGGGR